MSFQVLAIWLRLKIPFFFATATFGTTFVLFFIICKPARHWLPFPCRTFFRIFSFFSKSGPPSVVIGGLKMVGLFGNMSFGDWDDEEIHLQRNLPSHHWLHPG